jgi:hypothetical protein
MALWNLKHKVCNQPFWYSREMHISDAKTLVEYFIWADNEILNACEHLEPGVWDRPASPDPGWHTLKGTLVHTLDVEYGWRVRLQDLPGTPILEGNFPIWPACARAMPKNIRRGDPISMA